MKQGLTHINYYLLTIILSMFLLGCDSPEDGVKHPSDLASQLGYGRQNPLIIGLDADYPPLEYVDDNGTPQGYDVEFTRILMQRLGIPFTYNPNSWENIAPDVLHGKVDLGMMIYSPYRKDSTNYSRAVFRLYYQVVYPKKSDDERFDFRNIEGKRIAYMNSRPVGDMLTSENAVKFSVTNLDEAMCDLVKGKYDAVICYRYQARYLIGLHHFENLLTDDISLPPREYCYVSHSKELINIIDRELLKMEAEGITDDVYVIKSTFGCIEIPSWVWYLLGAVIIVALIIINRVYSHSRKQLSKANLVLEKNNQELSLRNQELIVAHEKAMESDRMKSAFIQNMTHQIRTPLNIVTGFAQVINNEYETLSKNEMKMMVGQMMKNTDTITAIVTKLIDLSIQQSRHSIEKQDNISCNALCQEAAKRVSFSHPEMVVFNIETTIPDDLHILTNKMILMKVLRELLYNADHFTQKGSITLSCYQQQENSICFSITDTGSGIPEESRIYLFTKFFKPNEFSEGLGLGLTLCKNAIEQMGGTICLDEGYTNGTRFIITLPLS